MEQVLQGRGEPSAAAVGPSPIIAGAAAVVPALLALALRAALDPLLGAAPPLLLLLVAVAVAAWYGGVVAGIVATAIGFVGAQALFVAPRGVLTVAKIGPPEYVAAFAVSCALVIGLAAAARAGQRKAALREAEAMDRSAALAASEARFRATSERLGLALRAADAGVWDWDIRSGEVLWSPEYYALYGLDSGMMPSYDGWLATVHPDDRDAADAAVRRTLDTRARHFDFEFRAAHPGKGLRRIRAMGEVFYADDGTPLRMIGLGTDVTARREGEAALRRSEHFHRVIAELTSDYAWSARVEPDGRVVTESATEGLPRLLGYTLEELQALGWQVAVHEEEREAVAEAMRRVLRGETVTGEMRHRTRDGRTIWIRYLTRPILDDRGRVVQLIGAAEDITLGKAAILRLEEAQRTLAALLANVPEGITMCGGPPDFPINAISRKGLEYIGQPLERVLGVPAGHHVDVFRILKPDGTRPRPEETPFYRATRLGLTVIDEEWVVERPTGERLVFSTNVAPVRDDAGAIVGAITSWQDITQRKASEARVLALLGELRAADRRKDEFLATLAHELRNPLAPILNAVAVLKARGAAEPETAWGHGVIERQVRQMARLLDDLLDVSRITRNRLELRKEPVALAAVLEAAIETTRPLINAGRHELALRLPAASVLLYADPVRLAQVFSNLLSNAAKYTDPGGSIVVTASREGRTAVVSVRDSGIGIAPEMMPRLFEMFAQAAPALERAQGGLGIGLALVKGLVEMHGGRVEALSDGPGRGAEFVVRLPALEAEVETMPMTEPESRAALPPRRVLVADDNQDGAESLAVMLSLLGADVRTAADGMEAVEIAREFRPEIALLDIGMPRLNGYDAARLIRAEPWGSGVLLVALTGWGQEDDKRRAAEAGFDRHVTKPIDFDLLEALLREPVAMPLEPRRAAGGES